jgi:FAD dependent monooxygenase
VSGIAEGDCFSVYRERATILGFTGKNGTIFWFVFEDLGHALPLSQSPRYTAADVEGVCRAVADVQVLPGIPFKNILANRKVAVKVALEEGLAPTWHSDRMVIVGDAAHKVRFHQLLSAMSYQFKHIDGPQCRDGSEPSH